MMPKLVPRQAAAAFQEELAAECANLGRVLLEDGFDLLFIQPQPIQLGPASQGKIHKFGYSSLW